MRYGVFTEPSAGFRGLAMSIEEFLRRGDGNWSLGIAG
jgi:hypothetical protein